MNDRTVARHADSSGVFKTAWRYVGFVLTAVALTLDALVSPVLDPFNAWLSRRPAIRRWEGSIASLPAYAVLVLLLVPIVVRQGVKLVAFFLMATGEPIAGFALYIGSRIFMVLVCVRIYEAGRRPLLTIGWFESCRDWAERRKKRRVAAFRSTAFYHHAIRGLEATKARVAKLFGR